MLYIEIYLLVIAVIVLHGICMYKKSKAEHERFLKELENKAWHKRNEAWMHYGDFM